MEYSLGYREVIPSQTATEKWTEFTLNTGGTQSTLQDIKITERSGGYSYKDQSKYYTRNRFIYWRICHDVLELVELSLDVNLIGNRLRYKFVNTPILDGITIHEVFNSVVVLVATVSSVHRLSFPHPDTIHNQEIVYPRFGVEYSGKSIFAEATLTDAKNPASFHIINNSSAVADSSLPHISATGLSRSQQHFFYALAYNNGLVLLIKLDAITGVSNTVELKQHYDALMMPRFISRAFRGKDTKDEVTVSMLFQEIANESYLFCLCRDGNIRLWSTSKKHCSIVTDLNSGNQGTQDHILRKTEGPSQNHFLIGAWFCFASHSMVQILKPSIENGQFHLRPLMSAFTPKDQDLVDFAITYNQEIWAVFRSLHGETSMSYYRGNTWIPCILENSLDSFEIPIDDEIDAKQNYIDFIFHPGRFPVAVINKALSIYRKSNIITDVGLPTQVLKERVCAIIDAQVNMELEDRDYNEEDFADLVNNCWQKFYSCCVEYYESGTRPIGLFLLAHQISLDSTKYDNNGDEKMPMDTDQENDTESNESEVGSKEGLKVDIITSGVVLIKKLYVSLIRPMDVLEAVALNAGMTSEDLESGLETFGEGVSKDLLKLVKVLIYLDDNLPDVMKVNFDKNLRLLKSPIAAISEILSDDLNTEEDTMSNLDLMYNIAVNVEEINDIEGLMTSLLDLLDIGQPDLPDGYDKIENTKWLIHLGHLYGSQFATSLVVNSLQQMITVRYELCRCLLIFQRLLSMNAFQQFVDLRTLSGLGDSVLERTSNLTQCYFTLIWMTHTPIHPPHSLDSLENCASSLNLNATSKGVWIHNGSQQNNRNITILELFLQSTASTIIRLLLSKREIPQPLISLWHHTLLPYIHILSQLVWPICNNTVFPEFLLSSFQYLHVQEYTRLLSKWCHSNSYTRKSAPHLPCSLIHYLPSCPLLKSLESQNYLLEGCVAIGKFITACALLDSGEHCKAFDVFNRAAHGVGVDNFIKSKVIRTDEMLSRERLTVLYYLKVIKLFEQQNLYDLIIHLANHAISISEKDDPELPTLYSIVFLNHLQLGQYTSAYESLIANPDSDRKKDCLRQLVISLFDSRLLDTLMNFPFSGMQDDLERIIEGRARSLDVMNNDYYNFLYAFHTLKGSMRKAACVMYEQAFRLTLSSAEINLKILEKQCKCFVAAINSLKLVKPEDAWIVKPFLQEDADMPMHSGPQQFPCQFLKKQVEVLEISDILKEYILCRARLRILKFSPDHVNKLSSTLSPHEIIGILTNIGFYKDALEICKMFNVSAEMVLSGLAANCVRLDETQSTSAWEWLTENDISELGDGTAPNLAWRLLESFLEKYEAEGGSTLHRAITNKLLQLGVFVPHWLFASYKIRNPSELLRLLLENGRLEECSLLAIEYVKAVLGQGKNRFNLKSSMLPQNPTTWLPLNTFDLILLELEAHSKFDPQYKELHEELWDVLETYFKTAAAVSEDKIKLRQEVNRSAA